MGRLTLRLPDNLHLQLQNLAANEDIPLNRFVVNALTRHAALVSSIQAVPEEAVAEQRVAYTALLQSLSETSFEQIRKTLEERESGSSESGLSTEVVERIKRRVSGENL